MSDLYRWTCSCGAEQAMTVEANRILRQSSGIFHCMFGHPRHYPQGESSEEKMRRERDRLKQQLAQKDDEIRWEREARRRARDEAEHERRRANGYKGHAAKITKRAKAGVCPCCNRSFVALARHMATKHPEFTPEVADPPALKIVGGTGA